MDFGDRLYNIRIEADLSRDELAQMLGNSPKTIAAYENGQNTPNYNMFVKICNIFKRDANYFMQDTLDCTESQLNQEDERLISQYNNLSDHDKKIVDYILNMENDIEIPEPKIIYRFPVYEQQAAAGAGITGRDGKYTMENIFTDDIPQNAVFGVHIKGTSMINIDSDFDVEDIPDNSFVLLNPKVSVSDLNKTIVVASINNEVICKYFLIEQNGVYFYSLNRREHAGDDRFAKSPNEYRIIGQVVKIIKPNEHE